MTALGVIQAPISYGPAIELGNRVWAKRILPIGEINYKGRTLKFTQDYLAGLEQAFRDRAYDQVAFQLADSSNTHTNDPERFRGEIVDMQARDDGLWIYLNPTERGEQVLRENPNLGVSARIVEQYARSDGKHYPAAIQHVLGTLDPRIPALGAWSPVDMSADSDAAVIIDLSQSTFDADEDELTDADIDELVSQLTDDDLAALQGEDGELSDEELEALIEAELEDGDEDGELADLVDSLTDEELAKLEAAALADGYRGGEDNLDHSPGFGQEELAEYASTFASHYADAQVRELARADADELDRTRPAVSTEDRLARAFARIGRGIYASETALAGQRAAIELANSAGLCGHADPVTGRCAARYHQPNCSDGYESGMADGIELANSGAYASALGGWRGGTVSGPSAIRTEDPYGESVPLPAGVLEFAHELNGQLGLRGDDSFMPGTAGWDELLDTGPASAVDAYAAMAREVGHPELAVQLPTGQPYPDVSALRAGLGL